MVIKLSRKKKLYSQNREMLLYFLFGIVTTLVGWVVYFTVLWAWKSAFALPTSDASSSKYLIGYTIAQILQWIAAVLFSFFTSRQWVFTSADKSMSIPVQLARFSAGRAGTLVIDYLVTLYGGMMLASLVPSMTSVKVFGGKFLLNFAEIAAKLISMVIVIICNYVFSKIFVFKNKSSK